LLSTGLTAAVFCGLASAVYIINDVADRDKDRLHPQKQYRPIAAGKISVRQALVFAVVILTGAASVSYFFAPRVMGMLLVYFLLNLAYSWYLKNLMIFDILAIAVFYLLRILVGGMAAGVVVSSWLVICVFFGSLLLIVGKRIGEMGNLHKRAVLQYYTLEFLNQLLVVCAGLTVVSYGLYSILGFHLGHHPELAVYSIIFVVLGVFRYMFLAASSPLIEFPESIIVRDKTVLASVTGWAILMFYVVYF
jgi:4-hydroxybenzoate polyprenyltransferase